MYCAFFEVRTEMNFGLLRVNKEHVRSLVKNIKSVTRCQLDVAVNDLATGPKGRGFKPGRGEGFSQHNFLRMGSIHIIRLYGTLKTLRSMIEMQRQQNSKTFLANSLLH
jgi:hypothetical protein